MGAWLNILKMQNCKEHYLVAPYMGAWIEIAKQVVKIHLCDVAPSWVRGLNIHELLSWSY